MSINEPSFSSFIQTTLDIQKGKEAGNLYLKELNKEGKVKSKKGWKFIKALFGHFFFLITGKAKQKLESKYNRLIDQTLKFYKKSVDESSPGKLKEHAFSVNFSNIKQVQTILDVYMENLPAEEGIVTIPDELHEMYEKIDTKAKELFQKGPAEIKALHQALKKKSIEPKEVKLLAEKLEKGKTLSTNEKKLVVSCLKLGPEVVKTLERKDVQNYFNVDILQDIKKVGDRLLSNTSKLHDKFQKDYGSISDEIPTCGQLLGAFRLVLYNMKELHEANQKAEDRVYIMRAVQVVMFGKKIQKDNRAKQNYRFTFKEAEELKNNTFWKNNSVKDIKDLSQKLSTDDGLNEREEQLLKSALEFGSDANIKESFEKVDKLNKQIGTNFLKVPEEIEAIRKLFSSALSRTDQKEINDVFYSVYKEKLVNLHKTFAKKFGRVSIKNNKPIPKKSQLIAAFKMAFENMPELMEARVNDQARKITARVIQLIMVESKNIEKIPYPKNDVCFTFKELSKKRQIVDLQLKEHSSFFDFHLTDKTEIKKKKLNKYIHSFYLDNIPRPSSIKKIGDEEFELKKESLGLFITKIKEKLLNVASENPQKIIDMYEEYDKDQFLKSLPNKFEEILKTAFKNDDDLNAIENNIKLPEDVQDQDKLSSLLKIRVLELMSLMNQSIQGFETIHFPELKKQDLLTVALCDIGFSTLDPNIQDRRMVLKEDIDGLTSSMTCNIGSPNDNKCQQLLNIDKKFFSEAELLPLFSFDRKIEIHQISPRGEKTDPLATFCNYENFLVSPDTLNILDKVLKTLP